jgi:hypothetical protein
MPIPTILDAPLHGVLGVRRRRNATDHTRRDSTGDNTAYDRLAHLTISSRWGPAHARERLAGAERSIRSEVMWKILQEVR